MVRGRIGAKGTGTVNTGGKGKTKPETAGGEGGTDGATGEAPKTKIAPASTRATHLGSKD